MKAKCAVEKASGCHEFSSEGPAAGRSRADAAAAVARDWPEEEED